MPKILRLQADYDCPPIWSVDEVDYLDPQDLDLSSALRERIKAWAERYDQNYAADSSKIGFPTERARAEFHEAGRQLSQEMQAELAAKGYQVEYRN